MFKERSESPDNVDVKFKVAFIHFPFECCKTWLHDADEILKSLKMNYLSMYFQINLQNFYNIIFGY